MRHAGRGLRAKILNDDFLYVPVSVVERVQRKQRVDPLLAGFPDADQNAGGERHVLFAGRLNAREPRPRMLIGRPVVGAAALAQPLRCRLEHEPLGERDGAQRGHIGRRQMAGIEMRKQSGLVVDRARGLRQIRQGRAMSEAGKLIGGAAVAQLRLVAEREQCLLAARGMTRPRNGQRFVEGQICPLVLTRRTGKRAVMANVTAKFRQRNKNLA